MKFRTFLYRIPRPVKACFFALLALFMAVVYYIALGCPTTFRQEFRRAERAHMVGPSEIVDTLNANVCEFQKMIVGETQHGVCFFGRYGSSVSGGKHSGRWHYRFFYHEKTGDITILAAPEYFGFTWDYPGYDLPVYIFTDYTQAVRAEIDLTINGTHTENTNGQTVTTKLSKIFTGEATLVDSGVFRYIFTSEDVEGSYALFHLAHISSGTYTTLYNISATSVTALVRLYDETGALITEETLRIQN